jgi:hypothetical protein
LDPSSSQDSARNWIHLRQLDGQLPGGLLDAEDVEAAAERLAPNGSVALIVWENTWAAHFVATLRDADAQGRASGADPE